jgi:hypothetical protein
MQYKAQLEAGLESARTLVKAYFEVEDCPWEKRYHVDQPRCRECVDGYVCEWLFRQDPPPDLSLCPPEQLRDVLSFAVSYLEGRMFQADHEADDCPCAICVWVRETHRLLLTE